MTTPAFQAPQPRQPQTEPTERTRLVGHDRYQLSPEEIARRITYLDKVDRRCDANGKRCYHNAANVELTVRNRDPRTGEPAGDPYKIKSCARHRRIWEGGIGLYEVLDARRLEPGRLKPSKREQREQQNQQVAP